MQPHSCRYLHEKKEGSGRKETLREGAADHGGQDGVRARGFFEGERIASASRLDHEAPLRGRLATGRLRTMLLGSSLESRMTEARSKECPVFMRMVGASWPSPTLRQLALAGSRFPWSLTARLCKDARAALPSDLPSFQVCGVL